MRWRRKKVLEPLVDLRAPRADVFRERCELHYFSSLEKICPAGRRSPRSLRISMRFSASSSRVWQKRESCTPRSYSSSDFSSARSPSSSFLTIVSSSAIAVSKSLIVESISFHHFTVQLALGQRHADAVAGLH